MLFRDRTQEFQQISVRIGGSEIVTDDVVPSPYLATAKKVSSILNINQMASEIGKNIYETSNKLVELTKLAKSKSPFGDPADKIHELTFLVRRDISIIEEKISALEVHVKNTSTGNQHTDNHVHTLVSSLQSNLLNTTKEFSTALEIRTKNLASQQERRKKVTGKTRSGPSPMFQPAFDMYDNFDEEGGELALTTIPLIEAQDDLIVQERDAVREIAGQLMEVRTLFERLTDIVAQQHEQVERLEDNIHDVHRDAEKSVGNLVNYLSKISGDRRIYMSVGIVLVIFFIAMLFVL
eukprot:TRINITY_DN7870_c0_g1_i1.p1 TRINITY_DN7870_c0_g1~~TRINITY_DN7870_c0_g1_i1.p1  ORF type:complete len:294 (-),score=75.63 TRINITY_DN7870_c0_g1_i1:13-894(-)